MSSTTFFFFIIFLHLTSAGAENIRAVVGENVTLPCKVLNNNSVTVVDWIRPDLDQGQVIFYRNKKFDPDYQHPSFQNRVDLLDLQKGDVSLILRNLKMNDSGTYLCHVVQEGTNRRKRDADDPINTINLLVGQPRKYLTTALVVAAALVGVVSLILKRRQNNSSSRPDEPADVEMNHLNHDDRNKQAEPS